LIGDLKELPDWEYPNRKGLTLPLETPKASPTDLTALISRVSSVVLKAFNKIKKASKSIIKEV
jgi:hypothetical protein